MSGQDKGKAVSGAVTVDALVSQQRFRCDGCGRFVSADAVSDGRATHVMVLPDSAYTKETWLTECPECKKA